MTSGYWKISLNPYDREKTSFAISGIGTNMLKVMCFGLKKCTELLFTSNAGHFTAASESQTLGVLR